MCGLHKHLFLFTTSEHLPTQHILAQTSLHSMEAFQPSSLSLYMHVDWSVYPSLPRYFFQSLFELLPSRETTASTKPSPLAIGS